MHVKSADLILGCKKKSSYREWMKSINCASLVFTKKLICKHFNVREMCMHMLNLWDRYFVEVWKYLEFEFMPKSVCTNDLEIVAYDSLVVVPL